ncbi:MAG: hypothetical protein WCL51_14530 [Bacteroidota bacterium]
MKEVLDEEKAAQLSRFMQIIDLYDKNEFEIRNFPEVVGSINEIREIVKQIMDLLTDEQKDHVLEVHKSESEYRAKKIEKEKRKE